MRNDIITLVNKSIVFSFYALFFLLPLLMHPTTYELFEFNKMWFVFGVSLFIFFLWSSKSILSGKIEIRRTPFDIPILLFVVSQIISTVFSIDSYVSFWGYYSRFNGGLLSTFSYVFLYYAFASNLIKGDNEGEKPVSYRFLIISLISGLVVALWGLPSHFGYDPTCLVFRGTFDVSCWTDQFQPRVRIFSTLGQPNWLGTYLGILLPIAIGFGIISIRQRVLRDKKGLSIQKSFIAQLFSIKSFSLLLLIILFYLDIIYARSQSSFLGAFFGLQIFFGLLFIFTTGRHKFNIKNLLRDKYFKYIFVINVFFLAITFFETSPIGIVNKYFSPSAFSNLIRQEKTASQQTANQDIKNENDKSQTPTQTKEEPKIVGPALEAGGSDSGAIRLFVWRGAIDIFLRNPLFGTGVETFAFAYYKVKPAGHNLTSEWDYLYNKAHNEYLNYLATTGIFGLGSYLLFIFWFFIKTAKDLIKRRFHDMSYFPVSLALIGAFVNILISNFFGFSVVMVNLFFFFIPLMFYEFEFPQLLKKTFIIPFKKGSADESISMNKSKNTNPISIGSSISVLIIGIIVLYLEVLLINYWMADIKYALGYNLDRIGEYTSGYQPLTEAVKLRQSESLFKDELSVNLATLAVLLYQQGQKVQASQMASQAVALSDEVIKKHPNNVVYFKTRTRVFYSLAQIDPKYLIVAKESIERAIELAPTDAKLVYNLGLLYNQVGDAVNSENFLKRAAELKPNYQDAWYALAVIYNEFSKQNTSKDQKLSKDYKNKALLSLDNLFKLSPDHPSGKDLLKSIQQGK